MDAATMHSLRKPTDIIIISCKRIVRDGKTENIQTIFLHNSQNNDNCEIIIISMAIWTIFPQNKSPSKVGTVNKFPLMIFDTLKALLSPFHVPLVSTPTQTTI